MRCLPPWRRGPRDIAAVPANLASVLQQHRGRRAGAGHHCWALYIGEKRRQWYTVESHGQDLAAPARGNTPRPPKYVLTQKVDPSRIHH